jgi:hypothetical protein
MAFTGQNDSLVFLSQHTVFSVARAVYFHTLSTPESQFSKKPAVESHLTDNNYSRLSNSGIDESLLTLWCLKKFVVEFFYESSREVAFM